MPDEMNSSATSLSNCLAFQAALQRGEKPNLLDFLPTGQQRLSVLIELVHAELRYRRRAGENVSVQEYLMRFPELRSRPGIAESLLQAQFNSDRIKNVTIVTEPGPTQINRLKFDGHEITPNFDYDPSVQVPGYQILDELGKGGMGVVVRALDHRLNRLVAIKVMKSAIAANPIAPERFLREARLVASLKHDHIVSILHVGEHNKVPYIVMPLLEGESLDSRIKNGPRITVAEALRIARETAEGLAAAHAMGLMHRDIKPANIWLEWPGARVKILDFGLARQIDDHHLTQSGLVLGTPAYMAPEQAAATDMDSKVDLFSLGCVLYEMLLGTRAFQGRDVIAILNGIANHRPPLLQTIDPTVPAELSMLVRQLLEKDPQRRFGSAGELAKKLRAIENRFDTTVVPVYKPLISKIVSNKPLAFRLTAGIVAAALIAWLLVTQLFQDPPVRTITSNPEPPYVNRVQPTQPAQDVVPKTDPDPPEPDPEPDVIPKPDRFPADTIVGGGAAFVMPIMEPWRKAYEPARNITINYSCGQPIGGSAEGIEDMIAGKLMFACTDAYMTDEQLRRAQKKGGPVLHIPLVMNTVVPAYNLPGVRQPLKFTGSVLADIYLGKIKKWNDGDIVKLNPKAKLPELDIKVVNRSDSSGTTYIWTDYLSKKSKAWTQKVGTAVPVKWPVGTSKTSNRFVAVHVRDNEGAIGYVELRHALEAGLIYGEVKNVAGKYVAASPESVHTAVRAATGEKAFPVDLRYTLTDAPGNDSYPIVGTTWAVLYANQTQNPDAVELVEFLRWATHEGQWYVKDLNYVPLPPELVERGDAKLKAIQLPKR